MSTLKVDTYLTRGGASEIAIDKLKGVTAAGSMLVVGEGGTNTTNLQQGLAKQWLRLDGTGTVGIEDSLNTTSITDNDTGKYGVTIANDMANANYCMTGMASDFHVADEDAGGADPTTGAYRLCCFYVSGTDGSRTFNDEDRVSCTVHGDLA
jgi:hypothetical protein